MTDEDYDRIQAKVEAMIQGWPNLEEGVTELVTRLERVEALADVWDRDQNPHAAWLPIDFAHALRAALADPAGQREGEA